MGTACVDTDWDDTHRCSLDGEALQGLIVGQLARLTLLARDQFGNACSVGGETVDVDLRCSDGTSRPVVLCKRVLVQSYMK